METGMPPSRDTREFDMIIFGASGFTGKYATEQMAVTAKSEGIKWAVAGRSKASLQDCLDLATKFSGIDVTNIPILKADIGDKDSIIAMCRRTKVVLNCVGPYILYGEIVVKACIDNLTDQLDISGERYFMDHMQLKYDRAAEKARVYVLSATGLGNIPIEVGLQFLKAHFDGDINSVDTFIELKSNTKKDVVHYGTYESQIYNFKTYNENIKERKQLLSKNLPKSGYQVKKKKVVFSKEAGGWCSWLPSLDSSSQNTDYYNYHHRNMRPMNNMMYMKYSNYIEALLAMIFIEYISWFISQFSWGRKFLKRYHNELTGGAVSKKGPSRETIKATTLTLTMTALGYSTKTRNPEEQHDKLPDKKLAITIDGPDPIRTTPIAMIQAALCVLREREKLPNRGGVLPVGAALLDTNIIERLQNNGFDFRVRLDL